MIKKMIGLSILLTIISFGCQNESRNEGSSNIEITGSWCGYFQNYHFSVLIGQDIYSVIFDDPAVSILNDHGTYTQDGDSFILTSRHGVTNNSVLGRAKIINAETATISITAGPASGAVLTVRRGCN